MKLLDYILAIAIVLSIIICAIGALMQSYKIMLSAGSISWISVGWFAIRSLKGPGLHY